MKTGRWNRSRAAGMTILEVLFVVAILGLVAAVAVEAMTTYGPRIQLRQTVGQAAQLINKARIEAIKRGVTTVVEADANERSLIAFADVNGNPSNPLDPNGQYLVFDPAIGVPRDRTDYLISTVYLPGKLETGVRFTNPDGSVGVTGFTRVPDGSGKSVLVFRSTGAVIDPGAFRFSDARQANFLETSITAITGKIEVRKYLDGLDTPSGTADFYGEGNVSFDGRTVGENLWVWY